MGVLRALFNHSAAFPSELEPIGAPRSSGGAAD